MKAVIFSEHGGPEVLRYTDAPKPQIGHNEVLVQVRACALNHLDIWSRKGMPGVHIPFPHILGNDVAGEVVAVGAGVTRTKVGEKIIVAPGVSCNTCDTCLAGFDNMCRQYKVLGYMIDGGYAEYVAVPEVNIYPKPENLSFIEAAAVPLVFLTAWHMLITRAVLKPAETVLVLGAGSGVGSAAIQIVKLSGAEVITTAGSDAKLEQAKLLGADHYINHSTQDIATEVKRITARRGVDVVFEHVGDATWEKSLTSLRPGGRLVTCGATTGPHVNIDIRRLFVHQWSLLGSYMGTRAELATVLNLVAKGKLQPVVDKIFPLAKAADAHRYLEEREQFGKIVLTID